MRGRVNAQFVHETLPDEFSAIVATSERTSLVAIPTFGLDRFGVD